MNEVLEIILKGVEFKKLQDQVYESIREKYKLKRIEVEVLYALSRDKDCNTPTEISKRFKLNRGHVSQAIDVLSRRELITSCPDKEDRRSTHYFPAETAWSIISEIDETHREIMLSVFQNISEEEMDQMTAISNKILANIRLVLGS